MKKIYTIISLIFLLSQMTLIAQTSLTGKITDKETGEEMIGANILVTKNGVFVQGETTDIDGNFNIRIDPGKYDLEVSYLGYKTHQVRGIIAQARQATKVDVQMSINDEELEELLILEYKEPLVKMDVTVAGCTVTSEAIRNLPTRDISMVRAAKAPSSFSTYDDAAVISTKDSKIATADYSVDVIKTEMTTGLTTKDIKHKKIKDSYFKSEGIFLEGKAVSKNLIPMAELNPLEVIILEKAAREVLEETKKNLPKAGQLTAGEWKDLDHWKDWKKQQTEESDFQRAKTDWSFYLKNRYSVLVENKEGQPLANVKVELQNKQKEMLWKTRTDNFGKAELWANIFEEKKVEGKLRIVAHYKDEKFTIKKAKPFKKVNKIKIKKEKDCNISNRIDILFAVDATGSMQDEINYLKSELQDVIQQVKTADDDLDIRLGAIFYRDHSDTYLTKSSPLDGNIDRTVNFINQQTAGGGGDFPEAVDVALEEAIQKQNWSEDAVARIIFLVLDAPPHMGNNNLISLQKSIRLAAAKGIKIIPITASGINRSTEYLMKSMAMATNGTYVFITDDSGIGNDHLEPSNKDFKVEFLNDLMVRLITENTDRSACEKEEEQPTDPPLLATPNNQNTNSSTVVFQEDKSILNKVKYFPNPATTGITIQLQETISVIEIISANGQVVKRLDNVQAGEAYLDLSGLSEGFYLIRFKKDRSIASGKLIIIKP